MEKSNKTVYFFGECHMLCKAIRITLQDHHNIFCFTDFKNCLDAIKKQGCDLLISDLDSPGINGVELLVKVKKQKPDLPVILTSATTEDHELKKVLKAGAEYILKKPFGRKKLLETIQIYSG